jgi:hypothetical protein
VPIQGAIAGALGLCLLEAVLTSDTAAARIGSAGPGIAAMLNRIVDPKTPLIGQQLDYTKPSTAGTPAAPTGTGPAAGTPSTQTLVTPTPAGAGSVPPGSVLA